MKKKSANRCIVYLLLVVSFTALHSCFKDLTQKNIVYTNDFEQGDLKGILLYDAYGPITTPKIIDFNGSKVLGRFNNNLFRLTAEDLPEHNVINVEFTLNIHDKWDGNYLSPNNTIPDIWQMKFNNNIVLLTTFSNTAYQQAYPNFYSAGNASPPRANAWDIDLPGVCSLQGITGGTASYKIVKSVAHSSSSFILDCSDALQPFNSSCLKSWSIDKLTITAIKY